MYLLWRPAHDLLVLLGLENAVVKYLPFLARIGIWMRWRSFVSKGDIVVQAGVDMATKHERCFGSNAIHMARIVGSEGRVIAIEPDPRNVTLFREFIEAHGIDNITVIEKALWMDKGKQVLLLGNKSWHNQLAIVPATENISEDTWADRHTVEADTLDSILDENGIRGVSHICMTINGAELEALEGMSKVLATEPSLLIASGSTQTFRAEADGMPLNERICQFLRHRGFETKVDRQGWIHASGVSGSLNG